MKRWWSNASLRTKGFLVLAIPVLCLIAVTVPGIFLNNQVDSFAAASTGYRAATAKLTMNLQLVADAQAGLQGYAATLNPAFLKPYDTAVTQLTPAMNHPDNNELLTPEENSEVNNLNGQELALLGGIATDVAEGALSTTQLNAALLQEQEKITHIRTILERAEARGTVAVNNLHNKADATRAISQDIDVYGLAVGILGGLAAMALFMQGIVRRVRLLGQNAKLVATEQPMTPFPESGDEIGRLADDLRRTATVLAERWQEVVTARDDALASTNDKDVFVARISHELRTPLSAVVGFGELLQLEDLSVQNAESVNHIVKGGYHLLDLINDILDMAQIQAGRLTLSLEPLIVAEVVADAVSLVAPLAAEKDLTFLPSDLEGMVVAADRQRLHQVLLNLLANAIKYNRDHGSITVTAAEREGATVRIAVTDTGVGVAPESMERLFLPFERLGGDDQRIQGTGVGLSLSKRLAEIMQGSMGATSELSVGSTFWIDLPSAELTPAPIASPASVTGAAGSPSDAGCVLYAEDNVAALRVFRRIFEERADALEVALQGEMALLMARRLQPRLIILDMHLPDMTGEDVLRQLKADPRTRDIPVVMVSAEASNPERDGRLLSLGAAACLLKPLSVQQITTILATPPDKTTARPEPTPLPAASGHGRGGT